MKVENSLSLRNQVREEIKGMSIDEAIGYIDNTYEFVDQSTRDEFINDMIELLSF